MMKDENEAAFETKHLPEDYAELAPDKSEIRLLPNIRGSGLAHSTFPPHGISLAVKHKTVEEIWHFIQGHGQVWRKQGDREVE